MRHAIRGSTCEHSIDLTTSPEAPVPPEDLLSLEAVLPLESQLVIQETAEEVTALAMESLVSPDTLAREVVGVTNAEYEQSRPIAGLGEEQERASDTSAEKGVMVVNSSAGAKQVAKTSVEESESEDEVLVVSVPTENQALGPSLTVMIVMLTLPLLAAIDQIFLVYMICLEMFGNGHLQSIVNIRTTQMTDAKM
jgi:hypothetical protein